MGAVISLIADVFYAIGMGLMAVVNAIGTVLMLIIEGVVMVIGFIISCLTCGAFGPRARWGMMGGSRWRYGI